jgi:hypothetical protein
MKYALITLMVVVAFSRVSNNRADFLPDPNAPIYEPFSYQQAQTYSNIPFAMTELEKYLISSFLEPKHLISITRFEGR